MWSGKFPEIDAEKPAFIANAIGYGRSNNTFVINMSFAMDENTSITDQINGAYIQDGLLLVAASGDKAVSPNVLYPANLPNVIAAASVDINDSQSSFSPSGSQIELSAPGESVVSTSRFGGLSGPVSGTSYATGHISGAAALLKSYNPSWSNVQIRSLLNQTASPLGSSNDYGSGLVQVLEAIRITVDISGPVVHSGSGTYQWNSSVQKADGAVSYQWDKRPLGGHWQSLGSNSSQSLFITSSDGSFELRVTVNDSYDTNSNSIIVDYDECPPTEIG